jgi:hypothetical protein
MTEEELKRSIRSKPGYRRHIYGNKPCMICGEPVTNNVFGYRSHMRKHMRRGQAIEFQRGWFAKSLVIDPNKMPPPTCTLTSG